jgi:hypothetical protein
LKGPFRRRFGENFSMTRVASIGSAAAVLLAATAVHAGSLPAPTGGGYIAAFPDYLAIGDQAVSGVGSAHYGPASITISTAEGATVKGSVPGLNPNGLFNAIASYTYYISLNGAPLNDVGIDFHYSISLTSDPYTYTSGYMSVQTQHGYSTQYNVGNGNFVNVSQNSYLVAFTDTNTPIKITVGGSTDGGSFYVDPMVTLDPTWVSTHQSEASGLSFDFGGIPNMSVSAVPEPSTWAMMLAGFAGLGFCGYRRNKAASVAA